MNITTYREEDLPKQLLQKGVYDIEVADAVDSVSQRSGADMIRLHLTVWIGDKVRAKIYDYLIDTMPAKLRHACDTFGLLAKYESGTLSAIDFEGRGGKAKIDIETDESGQYPPKNVVRDYVCRPPKPLANEPAKQPVSEPPRPETKDGSPWNSTDELPF